MLIQPNTNDNQIDFVIREGSERGIVEITITDLGTDQSTTCIVPIRELEIALDLIQHLSHKSI